MAGGGSLKKNQRRHLRKSKRHQKHRVLIVCEGRKTEPAYFRKLLSALRLQTVDVEISPGTHSDPLYIYKTAKVKQKGAEKRGNAYDKIYCVFDKDHHKEFQTVSKLIDGQKEFKKARSVPCIEYWFLLHYEYSSRNFNAKDCRNQLRMQLPKYEKGIDDKIFEELWSKTDTAKKHASMAINSKSPSYTEIHLLIKYLQWIETEFNF